MTTKNLKVSTKTKQKAALLTTPKSPMRQSAAASRTPKPKKKTASPSKSVEEQARTMLGEYIDLGDTTRTTEFFNLEREIVALLVASMTPAYSFAIGDMVKPTQAHYKSTDAYKRNREAWEENNPDADGHPWIPSPIGNLSLASQYVVTNLAAAGEGSRELGINGNAWFNFKDWELVQRATEFSYAEVTKIYEEEGE